MYFSGITVNGQRNQSKATLICHLNMVFVEFLTYFNENIKRGAAQRTANELNVQLK